MPLYEEIDLRVAVEQIEAEGKSGPDLAKVAQWLVEIHNLETVMEEGMRRGKPVTISPETFVKLVKDMRDKVERATFALAKEYINQGKDTKVVVDKDAMSVMLLGVKTATKVTPLLQEVPKQLN